MQDLLQLDGTWAAPTAGSCVRNMSSRKADVFQVSTRNNPVRKIGVQDMNCWRGDV